MKKIFLISFLALSTLSFASEKFFIRETNFRESKNTFYKDSQPLNGEIDVFSRNDQNSPILNVEFNNGKVVRVKFSNKNTYFEPENKYITSSFEAKKVNNFFYGDFNYKKDVENSKENISYVGNFDEDDLIDFLEEILVEDQGRKFRLEKDDLLDIIKSK